MGGSATLRKLNNFLRDVVEKIELLLTKVEYKINTKAINKMTSPPPSPSPLEGEGCLPAVGRGGG